MKKAEIIIKEIVGTVPDYKVKEVVYIAYTFLSEKGMQQVFSMNEVNAEYACEKSGIKFISHNINGRRYIETPRTNGKVAKDLMRYLENVW